jgi:hypothetical protein
MPIVYGKDEIRKIIKERLERDKQSLMKTVAGKEGKFLFVALEAMNYLFGSTLIGKKIGEWASYKLDVYNVIVSLKEILDVILTSGFHRIEAPSEIEFGNMLKSMIDHFTIAKYSHLLKVQDKYGIESAMIEEDRIEDLRDKEFYEAVKLWVNDAGSDPDWVNFYYTNYPEHRIETGKLIEDEFVARHSLGLHDLTNIDTYLQRVCENHLKAIEESKPKGYPFLYIKKKKLFRDFSQGMGGATTTRWLKLLEYRAGEDLVKYPLVPLKLYGKKIYTLMCWIFVPSNAFWGAWVSDLLLERRSSKAFGKWSSGYGRIFEEYIDEKLKQSTLKIKNLGKRTVNRAKYPEIFQHLSELRKTSFEIDRIFLKGNFCFISSCKAHDFLYDRKIQTRDFFFPSEEIEKKVDLNLQDMHEISMETECIASSQRILRDLGIEGTTLIPIVLTSRLEPMGVEEVREYYRRSLPFRDVPTLTIQRFFEFLQNLPNLIANKKLEYFQT